MDDELLGGGMANPGAVFRRGDSVIRPAPPSWPGLHAFLDGLRSAGFAGAPVPTGPVVDGREQLEFVAGDVAHTPVPAWADAEPVLADVGRLLRRYHDAAAQVPIDAATAWSTELSDPAGGSVLCHDDYCQENVVFRDGQPVAIIDFDFAAPGRPVWDLAMAAWYWAPMLDPDSLAAAERAHLDPFRRLPILVDGYGLAAADRAGFMTVMEQAVGVCRTFVAGRVANGETPFVDRLAALGGWSRWDRIQSWLVDSHDRFTSTLVR